MVLSQQQRLAGLSSDLARRAVAIGQALKERRIDVAERDATAAFALAPKHAEILYLFGRVKASRGQHEQAVNLFLQAQAARPDDALIWSQLGVSFEELKDFDRARNAFRKACVVGPEYSSCWFHLGRRMVIDGEAEAAVPMLRRAVEIEPHHAAARIMLANVLRSDGRDAEAEVEYRAVIGDMPGSGAAWRGMAMLKPMPLNDTDIMQMHRQLREGGLNDSAQAMIRFALAITYEHRDDYAQAFEQFHAAHALMRKTEKYDGDYFSKQWNAILDMFPGGGTESGVRTGRRRHFHRQPAALGIDAHRTNTRIAFAGARRR